MTWPNDRAQIAKLAMRFAELRKDTPVSSRASMKVPLSTHQLEMIEECLLGTLTAMTKRGWCWFREESANQPIGKQLLEGGTPTPRPINEKRPSDRSEKLITEAPLSESPMEERFDD